MLESQGSHRENTTRRGPFWALRSASPSKLFDLNCDDEKVFYQKAYQNGSALFTFAIRSHKALPPAQQNETPHNIPFSEAHGNILLPMWWMRHKTQALRTCQATLRHGTSCRKSDIPRHLLIVEIRRPGGHEIHGSAWSLVLVHSKVMTTPSLDALLWGAFELLETL